MLQYVYKSWATFRALVELLQPFRRTMIWLAVILVIIELHTLLETTTSAVFFRLATENFPWQNWVAVIVFFVAIDEVYTRFDTLRHRYIDCELKHPVAKHLKVRLLAKFQELDLIWHHQNNPSALIGKVHNGVEKILQVIDHASWDFFPGLVQVLFALPPMLWFAPWTALVLVLASIVFFYLTIRMHTVNETYRIQRHDLYEKEWEAAYFAVISVEEARLYGQRSRVQTEYDELYDEIVALGREETRQKEVNYRWRNRIVTWARLGVWVALAYQCRMGMLHPPTTLQPASIVFIGLLAEKVFYCFWRFNHLFDQAAESKEGIDRIGRVLATTALPIAVGTYAPTSQPMSIEFDDVHFSYGTSTTNAIHGVSFRIRGGECVAIVGESGAGKSTLLSIMTGQLAPQLGTVKLDGVPLTEWDIAALEQQFAYVAQATRLSIADDTFFRNINYGKPAAGLPEIERAARQAGLHDFIAGKPEGYQTYVGDRGVRLSGGQGQRLGIARAMASDRFTLVLDEASSSVDVRTERYIHEEFERIRQGRTMVIVAHRLSTVRHADRILVMKAGRIVEEGTYNELIDKGGNFAKLVELDLR